MFKIPGIVMSNLSDREKNMLLALLLAILIFLNYRYLLGPQIQSYQAVKSELNQVRLQAAEVDTVAASLQSESDAVKVARQRLEKAKAQFSMNMQDGCTPFLLGKWAIKDRVIITSYQPGLVANKEVYLELPLKIGLRGDYPDVLTFIKEVEEMGNLTEIRYLMMKPYKPPALKDAGAQPGGPDQSLPLQQDGTVVAEISLIMYSDVTPQGRLVLDEMSQWPVGKGNSFLAAQE